MNQLYEKTVDALQHERARLYAQSDAAFHKGDYLQLRNLSARIQALDLTIALFEERKPE